MTQYEMMELSFHGPKPEGSEVTVDVTAVFTHGDKVTTVKGFYAGNNTYKVRFLPLEAGEYAYTVTGIISAQGTAVAEPAHAGQHGPVHAEGIHLRHADGSWFFGFGTTVYALAHQDDALTEQTFETLAHAPFNKVRLCVFPKHYNYNINDPKYFPFETFPGKEYHGVELAKDPMTGSLAAKEDLSGIWDVNHPCYAFWDAFEAKLARLNELGIQADLILFHPYDRWGFASLAHKDNMTYLDYVVRRLSAFPNLWWSLANEYDLCSAKSASDWVEFAQFIAQNDPYHHLLSNHNCFAMYDFSQPEITHCSIQKRTMNLAPELQKQYGKPVCYDECAYEGNLKETWGSISASEMVNRFWKATVTGACCTHGEVLLDPDLQNVDEAVLWWAKGGVLHGESPKRIAFLREVIESIGSPLEPMGSQLSGLLTLPEAELQKMLEGLPPQAKRFLDRLRAMGEREWLRQIDSDYTYAGKTLDGKALLYYYRDDCHARVDISLPADHTWKIEVLDAWNMTRETVAVGASGKQEVRLPGRPYMAVLATAE